MFTILALNGHQMAALIISIIGVYSIGFVLTWKILSAVYGCDIPWYSRFLTFLSFVGMVLFAVGVIIYGILWNIITVVKEVCKGNPID